MPRKPDGEIAMTGAERQAKQRDKNAQLRDMLWNAALTLCRVDAEYMDTGKLSPGTIKRVAKFAAEVRAYDGPVTLKGK